MHVPILTRSTYRLMRLEALLLLGISSGLALLHLSEIDLLLFAALFVYIDLFGYLPGAVAHHRRTADRIAPIYYYAYNTTHSLLFNALLLVGIWQLSGADWAMLAVPIHLFGDRALFGNFFKSPLHPFEPIGSTADTSVGREPGGFATGNGPSETVRGSVPVLQESLEHTGPRLAPLPREDDLQRCGLEVLRAYSQHSSAFLAMNQGTRHFTSARVDGFIAYRPYGGHLFMIGSVYSPPADRQALFEAFRAWARASRKRIAIIQLAAEDVGFFRAQGFRINQLGTAYTLDLRDFTLAGTRFMKLRNKLKRVQREGVEVEELEPGSLARPEVWGQLEAITAVWLATKGRHAKLLEFMVGELSRSEGARRIFVARRREQILGFITYVPVFGPQAGWMHDLSRRRPDAPPGMLELINVTALERFRDEGVGFLHFGLTPFVGVSAETDRIEGGNRVISWAIRRLAEYGAAIYPAKTQAAYKEKWGPQHRVPEYFAFESRVPLLGVPRLLLLTRAI